MKTEFLSSLLKNKHNRILYVILIIGIVLMLLPGRAPAVRENPRTDRTDEEKLADIISAIDGAGMFTRFFRITLPQLKSVSLALLRWAKWVLMAQVV